MGGFHLEDRECVRAVNQSDSNYMYTLGKTVDAKIETNTNCSSGAEPIHLHAARLIVVMRPKQTRARDGP